MPRTKKIVQEEVQKNNVIQKKTPKKEKEGRWIQTVRVSKDGQTLESIKKEI